MIKSILLPIDGSTYSEAVLEYGQYWAKKLQAVLRVLTVVDIRLFDWSMAAGADSFVPVIPSADFQEESQKVQDDKAGKVIERAATILEKSKVKFELIQVSGIPVDEICYHAKTNDMVIMGIRGEYERWTNKLLGATIEAVTRQITKPTMLVDKTFTEISAIQCGYDGSSYANKALQFSGHLASTLKIPMKVISVFDSEEDRRNVLNEAKQYLSPFEIDYKLCHETGDVADVLVKSQTEYAVPSLIVIGSYGHSRLREAILGSTTVQVMRKAKKPIMLVR